jgi:L-lactate dehydrogenase (cytochrome)
VSKRQVPKWRDLKTMIGFHSPTFPSSSTRLADALTISDLRTSARRRTPRSVFDYVDGAAEAEVSLGRARRLFRDLEFEPSVLRDVSVSNLEVTSLGRTSSLPFALAPTGFTRMMNPEGEEAVARSAARHDIAYALSTLGTTSIEDVARAAPEARKWFQLYVWRDRAFGTDLVHRAREAGFEALILTVDVPVAGARLRDVRNGFSIPPNLTPKALAGMAVHPAWWANLLTSAPLEFASLTSWDGTVAELIDQLFDPTMTVDDLAWLRSIWSGPLVVKGIQTVADAIRVADAGADVVLLSNHGGRQLDRAPVPLRLVPDTVEAVGDRAEVWVDTGIMNGADILACHALGADNVLVGRAYLYGLMAGGERGVDRCIEILETEIRRTLKLLGVTSVEDLQPAHVRLP